MSKAQCATCHFVPQFNGVKPPYVGSEFEVLGVPSDTLYSSLSADSGRYSVHPAPEMRNAFRTGTIRNAAHTAPYMHNGVFRTLQQVVDFYDVGGGAGHGLIVPNQTLSSDSLKLTDAEKKSLIAFMKSLDEEIIFEPAPAELPVSGSKTLNNRKSGGIY
jgi:cytochrome c peroxidase